MKLEAFFEKFEIFAEAPDAVARMRELVRHLAITGRLVSQNCDDEPASNLLRRIEREMSAEQRHRQGAPMAPFLAESQQYELPENWTWARFRDVAIIASNLVQPSAFLDFIHLAPDNIEKGNGVRLPCRTVREDKVISANHRFYAGQIVYSKIRPNLAKVVVVDFEGLCSADMYPIDALIDAYYLQLYMLSESFLVQAVKTDTRVAMPKINQTELNAIAVPVPPLAEQKRIVAKVDELMALCDQLEAQQQERETRHAALARASLSRFAEAPTPSNLNFLFHKSYDIAPADLRKSILTLAVQGKLVPQDPNDEGARAMIDRAMEKRRQTIKSKSLRRKELDESCDLFAHADLPSPWCVERFANLVDPENTISYGVLVPGSDVSDGIPLVRAQDLCLSNHPPRPNKTIAPEIEKPYARTRLTGGEILLCVVGSIGKLGVVPDSWAGANIARAVARIKPIPDVLRDYLLLVLQEQSVQNYFTSTTRTLAQPTLNVGMIEQTPIPIPPFAEQRRIVDKVEQLMTLVDALETQIATSRATSAKLLAAVVGEFTTQQ